MAVKRGRRSQPADERVTVCLFVQAFFVGERNRK